MSGGPPPLPPIPYPAWLSGGGGTPPSPAPAPAAGGGAPAPATFTLPPELKTGMKAAWDASFPGGKSQEQGGILVRKADGTMEWRPGPAGNSGSFSVNYGDLKAGETLVASAHTHPYDASEGGHTDVTFSGADIGNMALGSRPEDMKFVRSGDGIFMVQETQAFKDFVAAKGDAAARAEVVKTWNDSFAAATGTIQERAEAAVKATCQAHHLDYFKGTGDTLTKVDVTK